MDSTTIPFAANAGCRTAAAVVGTPTPGAAASRFYGRRGVPPECGAIASRPDSENLFYGVCKYIDDRGGRSSTDWASLKRMVGLFPPSCIFDASGRVLHDSGAKDLIGAILFEPPKDKWGRITKLTIRCNWPQPSCPVLSVVNSRGTVISVELFGRSEWAFTLEFGRGGKMADLDSSSRRLYCVEIR